MKKHTISGLALLIAISCSVVAPIAAYAADPVNQRGKASYYRQGYQGVTASGEAYDPRIDTAAHESLPFGTLVRVTELRTGKSVVVRVNDRSPFDTGHIIDISYSAAAKLGMKTHVTDVAVTVVQLASNAQPAAAPKSNKGPRLIPVRRLTAEEMKNQNDPRHFPLLNSPEDGQSANRPLYRVQFGAFRSWQNAEAVRAELARSRVGAIIVDSQNPSLPYRLISSSVFFSQGEASQWLGGINSETANRFEDAFVTR